MISSRLTIGVGVTSYFFVAHVEGVVVALTHKKVAAASAAQV